MPVKNWKKEKLPPRLSKLRSVFFNKKNNKIIVIDKEEIGKYSGKKEIQYSVTYGVSERYGNVGTRNFKTKSNALAFAKAYMEKH